MASFEHIKKAVTYDSKEQFDKEQAKHYAFMAENGYGHVLILHPDFERLVAKATLNDSQIEWMDMEYYELEEYTNYADAFIHSELHTVAFVEGNVELRDRVNLAEFFAYLLVKNRYAGIVPELEFIGVTNAFLTELKDNECKLAVSMVCSCEDTGCGSYAALVIKQEQAVIVPFLIDSHSAAEPTDIFFDYNGLSIEAFGFADTKMVDIEWYSPSYHYIQPFPAK